MASKLRAPFFDTPCDVTINKCDYKITRKIDNGSFGQVYVAQSQNKNETVAIKIMSHERIKKKKDQQRIRQEIYLHSQIDLNNVTWTYAKNAGIVQIFNFDYRVRINDKLYTCIVMEYCKGSHLLQYLRYHPSDRLSELESFYFFQQIIAALECLHSQFIIHRDIKPQNLLLSNCENGLPILKLCDFGLAKKLTESNSTNSMCGTPNYVAPEIVRAEGHSYSADVWSAGIVLYIMAVKHHRPPFETGNVQKTMAKVRDCEVEIPQYLSPQCQSFLSLIFIKNKRKRIKIRQLKRHIWYRQNRRKLRVLVKNGLRPMNTLRLRDYQTCLQRSGYSYAIKDGNASLEWGGHANDDYCLEVRRNGEITVTYGGISTKTYEMTTIPIGFYEKYRMLYQFTLIQARNTPLIAISIGNGSAQNGKGKGFAFNTNHYAILVRSQHIDYCHKNCDTKTEVFIQFNKCSNEYIGYYQKKPFDVLQSELHCDDVLLFDMLKTQIYKYMHEREGRIQYPIVLEYDHKQQMCHV